MLTVKPYHPSKVQIMKCFTAKACGRGFRFSPFYFRTALRSAIFRSIPFIVSPILGYPRMSDFFISFRSGRPTVSFRSTLALQSTARNSKPKREAPFHPTQLATLHSVTTFAFPIPTSLPHFTISLVHLTSFSTPSVSVPLYNIHSFSHPQQQYFQLF